MIKQFAIIMFCFVAAVIIIIMLAADASKSEGLPHRPHTGNHGQGHSPSAECPNQYKETAEGMFLSCWGKRT
jgi:hypothetical protein